MTLFTSPHSNPYARLVANVCEHEGCWLGTERKMGGRTRCYVRANFRVPGLGRHVGLSAHILTWVHVQLEAAGLPTDIDNLWLAYWELRCSGLELDHLCREPRCRRPDHLEPVTRSENELRKPRRTS